MTKNFLILIYIAVVLVMSSLVRADAAVKGPLTSNGIIRAVQINPSTGILQIDGVLATPCDSKPIVAITKMDLTHHAIQIAVATLRSSEFCIQKLGDPFSISFDMKELPLTSGQSYQVSFVGSPIVLNYVALQPNEAFEIYKSKKLSLRGTLVLVQSQFALKSGSELVPVFSPDLDLDQYKNSAVSMVGYPVNTATLNGGQDVLAQSSQAEQ